MEKHHTQINFSALSRIPKCEGCSRIGNSDDRKERWILFVFTEGSVVDNSINEVIKLCRDTCFTHSSRPKGYPESLFQRFPIPENILQMVIGRLRSTDIYDQSNAYPSYILTQNHQ